MRAARAQRALAISRRPASVAEPSTSRQGAMPGRSAVASFASEHAIALRRRANASSFSAR
eukprot:scaffold20310_cov125-Isochrysis_galbana.AAC.5